MNKIGNLIRVFITTGSDDLRGGNNAYLTFNLKNRTSSREYPLGGAFGHDSVIEKEICLDAAVDLTTIKSITLRHDGSPRSGHPFDSYDNWDLISLRIVGVTDDGEEINIYNSAFDPQRNRFVKRFTGSGRIITLFKRLAA